MPRIQFSDVTPPERRSIRDIPIPSGGKRKVPISIKPEAQSPKEEPAVPEFDSKMSEFVDKKNADTYEYYYPREKKETGIPPKSRKKQWVFGTTVFVLIGVFIVSMMTVFASATVYITPKSEDVDVNMKIAAARETEEGAVAYEVVKLSKTKTLSVPAAGEEAVELKASGKIVIYNNFSSEPQRLIVRTRFESPEGLIYRIPESVVVPGKSVKNGVETPGSIEVEIFADEAGEKYNIKKSDFTIPGFKNDANRFKNFYGRSSTNMAGGFIGKMKKVAEGDKQNALQNIDTEAQADLKKELESKVPEGLALLSGSIMYKSKELQPEEETSSVLLGKEVTAYAVMLNKRSLSDKIAAEYISKSPNWQDIKPIVRDFSSLKITGIPDDLETGAKMNLQINGKAKIWADIDTNIVNQRLLGAPKKDVAKLMNEFMGISSITSAIRPLWKQSFPNNPSKIYVRTADNP